MAQIGTVRLQTQNNGVVSLPVFSVGDSGSGVYEMVRVDTPSGVGFIPFTATADAAYPYIRIQTQNQGVLAATDSAATATFTENWDSYSTGTSQPGPWNLIDNGATGNSRVRNARSTSSPNSYYIENTNSGSPSNYVLEYNYGGADLDVLELNGQMYCVGRTSSSGSANRLEMRVEDSSNLNGVTAGSIDFVDDNNSIHAHSDATNVDLRSDIKNSWIDWRLRIDFPNNQFDVNINGTNYGPFTAGNGSFGRSSANYIAFATDNHGGYMDDLVVDEFNGSI